MYFTERREKQFDPWHATSMEFSVRPDHAYATTMVRPCYVGKGCIVLSVLCLRNLVLTASL